MSADAYDAVSVLGAANGSVHVVRLRVGGKPFLVRSQLAALLTTAAEKRLRAAVAAVAAEALNEEEVRP